jgi:hypothetical protein
VSVSVALLFDLLFLQRPCYFRTMEIGYAPGTCNYLFEVIG